MKYKNPVVKWKRRRRDVWGNCQAKTWGK